MPGTALFFLSVEVTEEYGEYRHRICGTCSVNRLIFLLTIQNHHNALYFSVKRRHAVYPEVKGVI